MKGVLHILLVEDNRGDEFLIREALKEHQVLYELHVIRDGLEAERFIQRLGSTDGYHCPDLLLLDLNLPKRSGLELLQLFRAHPVCGDTPVIVVTSSNAERDRRQAAGLGATRYFRKPTGLDEFVQLGAVIKEVFEENPA